MDFLYPTDAEETANIAQEAGADALRDSLRYPGETGGWQLDDVDLNQEPALW